MQTAKHLLTKKLKSKPGKLALSIYLPTHPKTNSQTITEDSTRLKNALKDIKNDASYNKHELGETVEALYKLVDDTLFWKHQTRGLAIFADGQGYEMCHLPYETVEAVYVQDRHILSPLAIMQTINTDFYVLDVNATKPRLLVSTDGSLEEVPLKDMPGSFQDDGARDEYKAELQHMNAPRGSGGDNKFHGHGVKDAQQHDMTEYLVLIAKAVNNFLSTQDLPLLLAGERSRAGNLRPHLNYKKLIEKSLEGNFETHTPQDLYNVALPEIRDYDKERQRGLIEELASSAPELVATGSHEISKAVKANRVKRLYIPAYRFTTDSIRPDDSRAIVIQLTDDMLDIESTIRDALSQASEIQAVEIDLETESTEMKALCRFPG